MGRRIVVMSNCQTGGLYAALEGMLPDDEILPIAWLGVEPVGLRDLLRSADVWVSSLPTAESETLLAEIGTRVDLVTVPVIWFPGFHPDVLHVASPAGGELESAVGPYNSAIVVWGWLHGLGAEDVLARFTPATFAALGYTSTFAGQVERLRESFVGTDVDFAAWYLPLARGGAFMLTDNHPRLDALVQVARLVATRLGADPELVRFGWEQVVPDGLLATSVVWPVYPPMAHELGLPGAYVWRAVDGSLFGLERFVRESLRRYASIDGSAVSVPRFEHDPRYVAVLAPDPPGPAAAPGPPSAPATALGGR